jgi:hypothetical protein
MATSRSARRNPPSLPKKSCVRLGHALLNGLGLIIKLWIFIVDSSLASVFWSARNVKRLTTAMWHSEALSFFWTWIFRIITVAGFAYLIYDRFYETEAIISSPVLNDQSPAVFLITITNISHLFSVDNVMWSCGTIHLKTTHGNTLDTMLFTNGVREQLLPGQHLTVDCNAAILGRGVNYVNFPQDDKIVEGDRVVRVVYDVDIRLFSLHLFSLPVSPPPTRLTWFAEGTTSQWIIGDFAK